MKEATGRRALTLHSLLGYRPTRDVDCEVCKQESVTYDFARIGDPTGAVIIIDESSSAPNQKEETFSVMMALMPYLVQAGIAPPVEVLDYLPLPSSFIAKWKEQLQPKGPSPQEQATQAVVQAEVAKTAAQTEMEKARARKEMAEAEAQEIENKAVLMGIVSLEDI
jgi:hypothetical protein